MFIKENIDEKYIKEFRAVGISDVNDILKILNGFDIIAEIGFAAYNNEL